MGWRGSVSCCAGHRPHHPPVRSTADIPGNGSRRTLAGSACLADRYWAASRIRTSRVNAATYRGQPSAARIPADGPATGAGVFTLPPSIFAAIRPVLREDGRAQTGEKTRRRCHQRNPDGGLNLRIIGQNQRSPIVAHALAGSRAEPSRTDRWRLRLPISTVELSRFKQIRLVPADCAHGPWHLRCSQVCSQTDRMITNPGGCSPARFDRSPGKECCGRTGASLHGRVTRAGQQQAIAAPDGVLGPREAPPCRRRRTRVAR